MYVPTYFLKFVKVNIVSFKVFGLVLFTNLCNYQAKFSLELLQTCESFQIVHYSTQDLTLLPTRNVSCVIYSRNC